MAQPIFPSLLTLSDQQPIAVGKTRYIYAHPLNENSVIKIHRRIQYKTKRGPFKRWFDDLEDRFVYSSGYLRELQIYFDSRYEGMDPFSRYIAPIEGIVDTDVGIGLVCRAVFSGNGDLAPTLGSLIKNNQMTEDRIAKVEAFMNALLETDLVVGDLNLQNVVLGQNGDEGEEFYLIDGLGERTFFRVQTFSKRTRLKRKQHFVAKVQRRIEKMKQAQ